MFSAFQIRLQGRESKRRSMVLDEERRTASLFSPYEILPPKSPILFLFLIHSETRFKASSLAYLTYEFHPII